MSTNLNALLYANIRNLNTSIKYPSQAIETDKQKGKMTIFQAPSWLHWRGTPDETFNYQLPTRSGT